MPARCKQCDKEIPADRITGFLIPSKVPLEDWTCVEHGSTEEFFGVMAPSAEVGNNNSGKTFGKTTQVLNIIPKSNPEALRKAKRFVRRAR